MHRHDLALVAFLLVVRAIGCGGVTEQAPGSGGNGAGATSGGGAAPQCTDASQCKLFSDCCSCEAIGPNEFTPAMCPDPCGQKTCEALGITAGSVKCIAGQCVAGIKCNVLDVFCNGPMPKCPVGQRPSVVNHCWGPCVPSAECIEVMSCADCDTSKQICVTTGDGTRHCADIPKECGAGIPTCACMGSSVCIAPYSKCRDAPPGDPNGTSLYCSAN